MTVSAVVPQSGALSAAELERMCTDAEVLEQDAHGLKVLRLPDGDMLKLFRVKRRWSSARLWPYSKRFCRNAARLTRLGIPTVSVLAWYQLPSSDQTAVLYRPLPGLTIRQISRSGDLDKQLLQQMGAFVARLHEQGVYFRSLHFGNIVQTSAGKLGLIDIADLSVRPWRLSGFERLRNFRHLCRLAEDRQGFGPDGWRQFCEAYVATGGSSKNDAQELIRRASAIFDAS